MQNPYYGQPSLVLRELVPAVAYEQLLADGKLSVEAGQTTAGVVLEKIFPAFPAEDNEGAAMVSAASMGHLAKLDVIHLQEELETRCKTSNARPFGVCPVREGIYKDCFDEIIRQISVTCPERGELLAELQSEAAETQRTYDMLFESACQYGARKAIERDLNRNMHEKLDHLTKEAAILENRVNEMRAKYEGLEKRFQERRQAEEKKHQEEVQFLKKGNMQLNNEIKRLTN